VVQSRGSRPLAGVYAKLDRGLDHLKELERQEGAFIASDPYSIVEQVDAETGWHIFTAQVRDNPPLELGIIAGETVHQFRSSLDHLLTAAARLRSPRANNVKFPLFHTSECFRLGTSSLRRRLRPEQFAIVERHQPYKVAPARPAAAQLAVLSRFNNVDKHEVVQAGYAVLDFVGFAGVQDVVFSRPKRIDSGTELCRYLPRDRNNVKVAKVIRIGIAYGVMRVNRSFLNAVSSEVGDIVAEIRAATPEFQLVTRDH